MALIHHTVKDISAVTSAIAVCIEMAAGALLAAANKIGKIMIFEDEAEMQNWVPLALGPGGSRNSGGTSSGEKQVVGGVKSPGGSIIAQAYY